MYRARSSTLQHARSAHEEPIDPGGDRLMNGLYSFCDLSVMQQAFWAHCKPSTFCKITPVVCVPATTIGGHCDRRVRLFRPCALTLTSPTRSQSRPNAWHPPSGA